MGSVVLSAAVWSGYNKRCVKPSAGAVRWKKSRHSEEADKASYRLCEGAVLLQELNHTVGQLEETHKQNRTKRKFNIGRQSPGCPETDTGMCWLPVGGKRSVTWLCAAAAGLSAEIFCALPLKVTRIHWLYCQKKTSGWRKRKPQGSKLTPNLQLLLQNNFKWEMFQTSYLPKISKSSAIPLWCSVS